MGLSDWQISPSLVLSYKFLTKRELQSSFQWSENILLLLVLDVVDKVYNNDALALAERARN